MTKRRRDRKTDLPPTTPLIALLVLLLANGQTLTVTIQPVCGS